MKPCLITNLHILKRLIKVKENKKTTKGIDMRLFTITALLLVGSLTSFQSFASSVSIEACDSSTCKATFKKYRKYARSGSPQAQMVLAGMYYSGYGVERSSKKSLHWYRQAGRQTNMAFAKLRAGLLFLYDKDIEQNVDKGLELLEKAADSGSAEAARRVADVYIQGKLVPQNMQKAEKWLLVASDLGDHNSQYTLGLVYEAGVLGEKQQQKAIELYTKAAKKNNAKAYERLSLLGALKEKEDIFAVTAKDNMERITVTAPDLDALLDISLGKIRDSGMYGKSQTCSRIPGARCRSNTIMITDKDSIKHSFDGLATSYMMNAAAASGPNH